VGVGVVGLCWNEEEVEPGDMVKEGLLPFEWVDGAKLLLFRTGVSKFVDRLIISLPCTTRLSVDFLRSLVSISVNHVG
jgi:hypothetical protein